MRGKMKGRGKGEEGKEGKEVRVDGEYQFVSLWS